MKVIFKKAATQYSPLIIFRDNGEIIIEGQSYPENAEVCYKGFIKQIKRFLAQNDKELSFSFRLSYLNTSSIKVFMNLFLWLDSEFARGKKVSITWLFDPLNELSQESGEEFAEEVSFPFFLEECEED